MPVTYLRDRDIVEGIINGENAAFESLVEVYGDRTLRVCYLILRDLQAAEDAVQETFIQVYRNISKFHGNSSLYTWIYKIAVNKCRDFLRKDMQYPSIDGTDIKCEVDIENEVIEKLDREKIKSLVFSMPAIYREVITLFYFEDMPIKDICSILDEGEGTVKSKLHRARNLLKKTLAEEGIQYGKG
ncbi:ECF RNA polymerase sigma factor SigW [Oxobacter pfennigii]|uniref:ECF RNA polymerase sigma factor SigW n=1 Tax=Oxobacter pfennigii TaxID=36849 RepID=A0A0N8NSV6_9CLOT|nr:sigma-70 family RNA polymerase sigma factor [Oxobacter pfennigii]KPU43096.1 ECF RNA polymerase sigma factor SigW [Oxobacter pfennigii]